MYCLARNDVLSSVKTVVAFNVFCFFNLRAGRDRLKAIELNKSGIRCLFFRFLSFVCAPSYIYIFFFLRRGGGGGGAHINYFGIERGPPKKILMKRGRHHILQELPV